MKGAFGSIVDQWLDEHPVLSWLSHHPFVTVGLVLLLLLLFQGLFGAIARFSEQFWLSLFQSPLKLGQWFFGVGAKSLKSVASRDLSPSDRQERLTEIFKRLEVLRAEQETLLTEVKSLLAQGGIRLEKEQNSKAKR